MGDFLQLIGSIVIGSLFFIGVLSFQGDVVDFSNDNLFQLLTQETAASFMEIIDHDFRRIGSAIPKGMQAISDTSAITFLGDVTEDGIADTVRYFIGPTSDASGTENPNDVILFRVVNGVTTISQRAGVTSFNIDFLDEIGAPTTDLRDVRMLDVQLTVESKESYNENYARALWEKRITPQNLNRVTTTKF